mgnify:CR=1 FL=1
MGLRCFLLSILRNNHFYNGGIRPWEFIEVSGDVLNWLLKVVFKIEILLVGGELELLNLLGDNELLEIG